MATFTAQVPVDAPPDQVWARLTDWTAHERWIPLTRVTILTADPGGVGARFVARTGIGPLAVDDVMEVIRWAPPAGELPGRCEVVKQGRVVLGGARFEVRPAGDPGDRRDSGPAPRSLVLWSETADLAPVWLTRFASPLIAAAGRAGLVRALRIMASELDRAGRT